VRAKRSWVAVAAMVAGLAIPASASAATTIGETSVPSSGACSSEQTLIQTASTGTPYAAPFAGVITSWSHRAASFPGQIKFKVARPTGGVDFTIVGEDGPRTTTADTFHTYPTRIPVQAGDVIGLALITESGCYTVASAEDKYRQRGDDPLPNTSVPFSFEGSGLRLDVSAQLEPDADNDGFGDETQDNCPALTNSGQQDVDGDGIGDPCDDHAQPSAQITRGPKDKTRKKTATFEFVGIDTRAVASFQCSLDGGAFATCTSPHTVKVKKGKQTFEVRAVDEAGNVGSPATDTWKRKKKK
jgi:hypothetical protein